MEVVKVLQKGQIVIPKDLREKLHIEEGKRLVIEEFEGALLVMPEPKNPIAAMRGLLKPVAEEGSVEVVRKLRKDRDSRWQ